MRKSNYDKRPVLHVRTKGVSAWQGWEAIGAQLRKAIAGKPDAVVCVDCGSFVVNGCGYEERSSILPVTVD